MLDVEYLSPKYLNEMFSRKTLTADECNRDKKYRRSEATVTETNL